MNLYHFGKQIGLTKKEVNEFDYFDFACLVVFCGYDVVLTDKTGKIFLNLTESFYEDF